VEFLEKYLKRKNILPDKVHGRYIGFMGKDCLIRIWYDGRVEIRKNNQLFKKFEFDEKKIEKYIVREGTSLKPSQTSINPFLLLKMKKGKKHGRIYIGR